MQIKFIVTVTFVLFLSLQSFIPAQQQLHRLPRDMHKSIHTQTHPQTPTCIEISAENNWGFLFSYNSQLKIRNNIQFLRTFMCLFISYLCSLCLLYYASLFFTWRQDDPWQSEDCWWDMWTDPLAAAQSCHQESSFQSEQCSVEMVQCLKAQAGASDKHKPRRSQTGDTHWGTAWPLLKPAVESFFCSS